MEISGTQITHQNYPPSEAMQLSVCILEMINQAAPGNGGIGTPLEEGDFQGKKLSFEPSTDNTAGS